MSVKALTQVNRRCQIQLRLFTVSVHHETAQHHRSCQDPSPGEGGGVGLWALDITGT